MVQVDVRMSEAADASPGPRSTSSVLPRAADLADFDLDEEGGINAVDHGFPGNLLKVHAGSTKVGASLPPMRVSDPAGSLQV